VVSPSLDAGSRWPIGVARRRAAASLRSRVAGADAAAQARRIWASEGERWFTRQDPIWRVHADASMFAGGLRALLLQSLHPLALTAVEEHSDYRMDPWARVASTSAFIAATTYGTIEHAEEAIARVRRIHATVRGTTPDGRAYSADDPHLLRWIHLAEVESFLTTYQRYGADRLSQADADRYVAQTGVAAARLGVIDPPVSEAQLRRELDAFRPELDGTPAARGVARYLLVRPPLPWSARPAYRLIATGAVATLPGWARRPLGLPHLPVVDALVGRPIGRVSTAAARWVMSDPSVTH
jgi:uncharacterized protein (DUF2236 family)